MNLEVLYKKIGTVDENIDCLYPIYLLYPQIPKYNLVQDEKYFKPLIEKHFSEVQDLQQGDLLLFKLYNGFHFGVYAGNEKFFHACKKYKLRLSRLLIYRQYLKGVYRWFQQ